MFASKGLGWLNIVELLDAVLNINLIMRHT